MSQIKYLVNAFLLLLLFATIYVFFDKFLSTEIIDRHPAVVTIDPNVPTNTTTITRNSEGHNLFLANCATCHALDKIIEGPDLRTVETRGPWVERRNLLAWVRDPSGTANKFEYTKLLIQSFNGDLMPSFPNLTDAEINAIFDYIKEASPVAPNAIAVN